MLRITFARRPYILNGRALTRNLLVPPIYLAIHTLVVAWPIAIIWNSAVVSLAELPVVNFRTAVILSAFLSIVQLGRLAGMTAWEFLGRILALGVLSIILKLVISGAIHLLNMTP